jgi:hypothetical protein
MRKKWPHEKMTLGDWEILQQVKLGRLWRLRVVPIPKTTRPHDREDWDGPKVKEQDRE